MTHVLLLHLWPLPHRCTGPVGEWVGVQAPSLQVLTDMRRRPVVMVGEASHAVEGGATGG